jgi:predicted RNase H-like nuclease (RuvC/YqgF family)
MEGGWWVAIGSVIATAVAAVGGVLINWLRERARTEQERLKSTADRHEVLIDRQEKQIARMQSMMDELYRSNNELRDEHATCQAEQESLWVWLQTFHRTACSLARTARAAGHDVDEIPPLPERRESRVAQLEFEARRMEQNRRLANELRPPPPASLGVTSPAHGPHHAGHQRS